MYIQTFMTDESIYEYRYHEYEPIMGINPKNVSDVSINIKT